jgi:2-(1,2-epoxy-1,2-dihydrophenyl)acetyl-CoA isomerase
MQEPVVASGVRVERHEAVAIVVLDRPAVMNRFEGTMREDLLAALRELGDDTRARAVMITGAGGQFSAGADIEELVALHEHGDVEEIRRRVDLGAAIVRELRAIPKPVVAAVDGNAAGAGMNLALACDVRVGSERSVFTESFVRIGLVPDWGGLHSLVRLVGAGRAADLVMTGDRVRADRAEAIGILQHVYPVETFAADALAYTTRLAQGPSRALAAMKEGLRAATDDALEAVLTLERDAQSALFAGDDCLAGLHAFLQKTTADFGGVS